MPLAPWKAVTGDNLFVRESGAVAAQFHDPSAIEPYASELVGQERGIVLGKKSGLDSVRIKAAELGLDVSEEQRAGLLADVKRVGIERRGLVTHEEFTELVAGKEVCGERIAFPADGLTDDTIRVRLPRVADAPSIVRGLSDKEILRGTGIVVLYDLTEDAVAERITTLWPGLRRTGEVLFLAIADLQTDEYLGNIQLDGFKWDDAQCEVGYWVLPEARGRGVSARATRLLSHWAIDALAMERVEATADFDNEASLRSLENAGFTREGTMRNVAQAQRGRVDVAIFSLVRADIAPRRRRRRKTIVTDAELRRLTRG